MGTALGRITAMKRIANTRSGNPRWNITLDDGFAWVTEDDAAFAGSLHDGMIGQNVELTLTPVGRITDVTVRLDPQRYVVAVGERASEWVLHGPFGSLAEAHLWGERYPFVSVLPLRDPYPGEEVT